jgi:glucose/arabinose dehydrogenase
MTDAKERPMPTTTRLSVFALALAALPIAVAAQPVDEGNENVPSNTPAFPEQTEAPAVETDADLVQTMIADGLVHPWAVAVLPGDRGYLVTERPGRLRHVSEDGEVFEPIAGVPEVLNLRQGGLLDVALAPDFEDSRVIYLTYAKPMGGSQSGTAAARAVLSEDMTELTEVEDIFRQEPPSPTPMHYGSRVVPAEDGHVYVTTGEHFTETERELAQDLDATYGKVVRVTAEGEVPDDNPFAGEDGAIGSIWSLGHRNIQGAALHPETGDLWVIEHGPAGGDELNRVEPGNNYGWPVVTYGQNYDGSPVGSGEARHEPDFAEPVYYWDPVIAPGGMVFYEGEMFEEWQGDVLAAGLVSASIVRLVLEDGRVVGEERLVEGVGRVRDVTVDDDGSVLFVTDFEDGALYRLATE